MRSLLLAFVILSANLVWAQTPEERIKELGIELPEFSKPSANYVKWRQVDNLLFLAGDGSDMKGRLGEDLTVEEGYQAARMTGVDILSTLKAACGSNCLAPKRRSKVASGASFWAMHASRILSVRHWLGAGRLSQGRERPCWHVKPA